MWEPHVGKVLLPAGFTWTEEDHDTLARTCYGEARGEPDVGVAAVAWVVVNRVARRAWYGSDIGGVCLKPKQFSCWNDDDPNRPLVQGTSLADHNFVRCFCISGLVLLGLVQDPTDGATHYHALGIFPSWARMMRKTGVVGSQVFYVEGGVA